MMKRTTTLVTGGRRFAGLQSPVVPFAWAGRQATSSSASTLRSARLYSADADSKKTVHVTFIDKDGTEIPLEAPVGKSVLELAHDNKIDLEGACEASLACSTCHVILDKEYYDKLPAPVEEEEDMLDLAFGLTETSRLGCQIIISPELEGIRLKLPPATRNMMG
ncbi:adrenodoxinlike ferredoxin 2 [Acanthamoeba castellanii str. Neff]|uniref:2Fe-2S ferredoxin n=2 Tax=Acanthamoeba castellanii TaxID=5755 RepID=L8GR90_ACACF|nr:adrenodoxinlike ferredoxin 2 [Acanthamoeba castellanii str. Neff]ELR15659.1 adrenodoxinlike ferredoxin 2 [Acanthamoeba castellanii str. Neff]